MPDIEKLDIVTTSCNTIGTQEADRASRCSAKTTNGQGSGHEKNYIKLRQEADRPKKYYPNSQQFKFKA